MERNQIMDALFCRGENPFAIIVGLDELINILSIKKLCIINITMEVLFLCL